ncbi:MAG: hypothetical protein LBG80_17630 [Bacteroidales bacterium]|jgi:hypothetical protein|nr:hypothetical protein [Bacteroidales bacterium]
MSNEGIATQLGELEQTCKTKGEKINIPDTYKEWKNKPKIIKWLCSEPFLFKIDLRDYYWISRDKLSSMQSNLLVSPIVKSLMAKLEPEQTPEKLTRKIFNDELKILSTNDQSAFFQLLKQRIITEPNNNRNYTLFNLALEEGFDCKFFYIEALSNVGKKKLPPAVGEALKNYTNNHPEFNQFINQEQKRKS